LRCKGKSFRSEDKDEVRAYGKSFPFVLFTALRGNIRMKSSELIYSFNFTVALRLQRQSDLRVSPIHGVPSSQAKSSRHELVITSPVWF
jgi:hypothetical protein